MTVSDVMLHAGCASLCSDADFSSCSGAGPGKGDFGRNARCFLGGVCLADLLCGTGERNSGCVLSVQSEETDFTYKICQTRALWNSKIAQ